MVNRYKYLLLKVVWLLCLLVPSTFLQAQTLLGVNWQPEVNKQIVADRVKSFSNSNVDLVIVPYPVADFVIESLEDAGIPFVVNSGFEFYTISHLDEQAAKVSSFVRNLHNDYASFQHFSGIILFNNSQSYRKQFQEIELSIVSNSGLADSLHFYNILNEELIEITSKQAIGTFAPFHKADEQAIHDFSNSIGTSHKYLFVSGNWLQQSFINFEHFQSALYNAESLEQAAIPLPLLPEETSPFHWYIFLLILLWLSLGANILINTTYKDTISRYFLSRRFFVDDILHYRERSSLSGFFLFIQHALFSGLVAYFMARVYISEEGIRALFEFAPYIAIFGSNYFSIFFITTLLIILLQIIALLWLYLPNPKLAHFNQALNIYTWIFHVDFILITALTVLFVADAPHFVMVAIAIVFVLIWFNSFNISALDTSKTLGDARNGYLIKTIGLHTILVMTGLVLLLIYNDWIEIFDLIIWI